MKTEKSKLGNFDLHLCTVLIAAPLLCQNLSLLAFLYDSRHRTCHAQSVPTQKLGPEGVLGRRVYNVSANV